MSSIHPMVPEFNSQALGAFIQFAITTRHCRIDLCPAWTDLLFVWPATGRLVLVGTVDGITRTVITTGGVHAYRNTGGAPTHCTHQHTRMYKDHHSITHTHQHTSTHTSTHTPAHTHILRHRNTTPTHQHTHTHKDTPVQPTHTNTCAHTNTPQHNSHTSAHHTHQHTRTRQHTHTSNTPTHLNTKTLTPNTHDQTGWPNE